MTNLEDFICNNIRLYSDTSKPLTANELLYWRNRSYHSGYHIKLGSRFGDLELLNYLPPQIIYDSNGSRWRIVPMGTWKCHNCGNVIVRQINRVTSKPSGRSHPIKNCGCRNKEQLHTPTGKSGTWTNKKLRQKHVRDNWSDEIRNAVLTPSTRYNTTASTLTGMPEYGRWLAMHYRCEVKSNVHYSSWGGRGIYVCKEWNRNSDDGLGFIRYLDWLKSVGYFEIEEDERCYWQVDRIHNDGPYSPTNCRLVDNATNSRNKRNNLYITDIDDNNIATSLVWIDFEKKYSLPSGWLIRKAEANWSLNAVLYAAHHYSSETVYRTKTGDYMVIYKNEIESPYHLLIPRLANEEESNEWLRTIRLRKHRNKKGSDQS